MQTHHRKFRPGIIFLAEQHKWNTYICQLQKNPFLLCFFASQTQKLRITVLEKEKREQSGQSAFAACGPGPWTDSKVLVCTLLATVSERSGSSTNYWGCVGCTLGHSRLLQSGFMSPKKSAIKCKSELVWVCALTENRQHVRSTLPNLDAGLHIPLHHGRGGSRTPSLQYITSKCDATCFQKGHYRVQVYVCFCLTWC